MDLECGKPTMTGDGKYTSHKKDDDWGMVYDVYGIEFATWEWMISWEYDALYMMINEV